MTARCELDHLVWAVPDLERGLDALENVFGTRPKLGGRHPGVGTHNALLDIGGGQYLEILAPDPSQQSFSGFGHWVAELNAPKLVTWAVRTPKLEMWCSAAREQDRAPGEIVAMHRERPAGDRLNWRLAALGEHRFGTLPFAIEWGPLHPCDDLPETGCALLELRLYSPDANELRQNLDGLGLIDSSVVTVMQGPSQLAAIFDTPRGRVELD